MSGDRKRFSATIQHLHPTPYDDLNFVLLEFVAHVTDLLGDNVVGAYLQGSFALGDFDEDSDVDFLVVVNQDLADDQLPALNAMHAALYHLPPRWAQHLEGSYVVRNALRRLVSPPIAWPFLDNGSVTLVRDSHDDSLWVRWILREVGVTLVGPDPRELVEPISPDDLRAECRTTLRTWGKAITANAQVIGSRAGQALNVLSCCRTLRAEREGVITSKRSAAAWAMATLDSRWQPLIAEALADRPVVRRAPEAAAPEQLAETVTFIGYCIEQSQG